MTQLIFRWPFTTVCLSKTPNGFSLSERALRLWCLQCTYSISKPCGSLFLCQRASVTPSLDLFPTHTSVYPPICAEKWRKIGIGSKGAPSTSHVISDGPSSAFNPLKTVGQRETHSLKIFSWTETALVQSAWKPCHQVTVRQSLSDHYGRPRESFKAIIYIILACFDFQAERRICRFQKRCINHMLTPDGGLCFLLGTVC